MKNTEPIANIIDELRAGRQQAQEQLRLYDAALNVLHATQTDVARSARQDQPGGEEALGRVAPGGGAGMTIVQIASICHEANRAYCKTIGDFSQPDWDRAPDWQRQSAIKGVEFHLGHLARGEKPSPAASHEAWLAEKERDGWKYGSVKDPEKKEHPCFVPYEQLPIEQRRKDYLFAAIVEALSPGERA